MNDMNIDRHRSEISTLSVTIKALHIDRKQMTLAVFRQLPEMDYPLAIEAEHWGVVNYSIDGHCAWSVCTLNGRLYRAAVPRRQPESPGKFVYEIPANTPSWQIARAQQMAKHACDAHMRRINEYKKAKAIWDIANHDQLFIAI